MGTETKTGTRAVQVRQVLADVYLTLGAKDKSTTEKRLGQQILTKHVLPVAKSLLTDIEQIVLSLGDKPKDDDIEKAISTHINTNLGSKYDLLACVSALGLVKDTYAKEWVSTHGKEKANALKFAVAVAAGTAIAVLAMELKEAQVAAGTQTQLDRFSGYLTGLRLSKFVGGR